MKKKTLTPSNLLLSLICMLCIISFSVVLTLNFRPLYHLDIHLLDIPETSGFSVEECRANYDALIQYNSIFYRSELDFPTFSMSEAGRIHFVEVKRIFDAVQILLVVTLIAGAAGAWAKMRKKDYGFLKLTSILTIAIPTVLGTLIALNWENVFVTFHHIFFDNDYWIFDPATDPVITILPDAFFMHCAILILLFVVAGSVACWVVYRRKNSFH